MTDGTRRRRRNDYRKGRVETGLERDLRDRADVGPAERSALRAQARAVDVAEHAHDSDAVSRANGVYLELRQSAGLTGGGPKPVDAFDQLLRQFTEPTAGVSDTSHT